MEDDVLDRARSGSADAFTALYRELAGPVAAYLRAKGVPDVEDVTSDVFVAVFTGIARFEGDAAGFRAWVFTIAHRRVVDTWRRAGRRPVSEPFEAHEDPRVVPSAEQEALERVGQTRALELLGLLTESQREVLLLRILADLSLEEVAAVVGRPVGAVKSLQHRGLAALRRILAKEGVSP
ncbi:RNA polymerase sigma factor [Isoptericola sp. b490]|uniref:RNA polymerase sigma factor n=1 Tax=Actinotalea lenta TaxID=3064654 RepID=UPI0027137802|nr:RNA polymerase sigma factor [Isoptericola sp. b490]MDO8121924.1 RNA polymerase sigma factor [Isoptericola sp. b490]